MVPYLTGRSNTKGFLFEVYMRKKLKLVFGVGLNDADYHVLTKVNGKPVRCPFYQMWSNMLLRCYDEKFQDKNPTYIGCSVCDEWLVFSKFKSWMETQDWQDRQLDKDLLAVGNKVYSPNVCVFVDKATNLFTIDSGASRGKHPIGASFDNRTRKFRAQCSNPITRKNELLGYFTCPEQAHQAWRKRKHEFACQLADLQSDPRVANALRTRYL